MIQCISTSTRNSTGTRQTRATCASTHSQPFVGQRRVLRICDQKLIPSKTNRYPFLYCRWRGGPKGTGVRVGKRVDDHQQENEQTCAEFLIGLHGQVNEWSTDVCHVMLPWWNSNENGRMYCLYHWVVGGGWKGFCIEATMEQYYYY